MSQQRPRIWCEHYTNHPNPDWRADWRAECPCGDHDVTTVGWLWAYEGLIGHLAVSHPRSVEESA